MSFLGISRPISYHTHSQEHCSQIYYYVYIMIFTANNSQESLLKNSLLLETPKGRLQHYDSLHSVKSSF